MTAVTLTDFNHLIETLPESQKDQALTLAYDYVLSLISNEKQHTVEKNEERKSMAGFLSEYANPSLIPQEKTAWQQAMVDKYANH